MSEAKSKQPHPPTTPIILPHISWYGLLQLLREKPLMYLRQRSLRDLEHFINGYQFARYNHHIPMTSEEQEWERFDHWINNRLRDSSTRSSIGKILLRAVSDEEAFYEYFKLLDEYRSEQNQR